MSSRALDFDLGCACDARVHVNLTGRVCVVTGATSGIGKITARELARQGAAVIAIARDARRGDAAMDEIRRSVPGASVTFLQGDLGVLAEVRRVAGLIVAEHPKIHALVNNAGAVLDARRTTIDGLEATFAVNHLGHFLLTHLLLGALRAGAPSRVVTVSSEAHRRGFLDFDDLQLERRWSPLRAYNASKVANVAFTRELSRRLAGAGVTANCAHPGVVATGLGASASPIFRALFGLARPLLVSEDEGAATQIHLASSPEVEGMSGHYFIRKKVVLPSRHAADAEVARRLWEASEALAGVGAEPNRAASTAEKPAEVVIARGPTVDKRPPAAPSAAPRGGDRDPACAARAALAMEEQRSPAIG